MFRVDMTSSNCSIVRLIVDMTSANCSRARLMVDMTSANCSIVRLIVDMTSANCSHQVQQELSSTFARLCHMVNYSLVENDDRTKQLFYNCDKKYLLHHHGYLYSPCTFTTFSVGSKLSTASNRVYNCRLMRRMLT